MKQFIPVQENFSTNADLAAQNPYFTYQVFLGNEPRKAAAELDADPLDAIRSCARTAAAAPPKDFLTKNTTFLGPWRAQNIKEGRVQIPASGIMTPLVEKYMVDAYRVQGF